MPRSNKKGEEKDPLQAVLLADSFTNTFKPITLEKPKVLVPIINVPMIEYTLEWLASNGVDEILVVCVNLASQVFQYLKKSGRWHCVAGDERPNTKTLKPEISRVPLVRIISDQSIGNAGDALRELEQRNMLMSDPFVLVSGDVIANIDLKPVLRQFKATRKKDKLTCMFSVFKQAKRGHPSRQMLSDLSITLDEKTNQILNFNSSQRSLGTAILCSHFKKHRRISHRYDLLDCGIDICSLQVCTDLGSNYDYRDLHKDYLASEVHNDVGNTYYAHVVESGYTARVRDLRTYYAVSKDVVRRWTYPLVPDSNFTGRTSFRFYRGSIYKEDASELLARTATIEGETVIGKGSSVESDSFISGSVIGRRCRIGKNVRIVDSIIFDDVHIEDNVTVTQSLLCNFVKLDEGCSVPSGCVVSYGVNVPSGQKLKSHIRLTSRPEQTGDDDDDDDDDVLTDSDDEGEYDGDERKEEKESDRSDDETFDVATVGGGGASKDAARTPGYAGCGREWTFKEFATGNEVSSDSDADDDNDYDNDKEGDVAPREKNQRKELYLRQIRLATDMGSDSLGSVQNAFLRGHNFDTHDPKVLEYLVKRRYLSEACLPHRGRGSDMMQDFTFRSANAIAGLDKPGGAKIDPATEEMEGQKADERFLEEVRSMLCRDGEPNIEDVAIEIKSFKLAEDRHDSDIVSAVVPVLMGMVDRKFANGPKFMANVKAVLTKWKPFLEKFRGLDGQEDIIEESVVAALGDYALQDDNKDTFRKMFFWVLYTFYDMDIVSSDAILKWKESATDHERVLLKEKGVASWIEGLEDSGEEDESDDDEEGPDEDDTSDDED
eukprot:g4833.t1